MNTPKLIDVSRFTSVTAGPISFDTEFLRFSVRGVVECIDTAYISSVFGGHFNGVKFLETANMFNAFVWTFETGCFLFGLVAT